MSGISEWFGWGSSQPSDELPEIFPISVTQELFIKTDVINIFSKILTDVIERVHGLSDDQRALLWDNCVKSNSSDGLITLLSKAMTDKQDLFLVYDKALPVLRLATSEESQKIRSDYEKQNKSAVGVFVSFKNYLRSDMVKLYSAIEYCTVGSLYKSMNLSKAIQMKMSDLRASTGLNDSTEVKRQALLIAQGLSRGRDVLVDAKDIIETLSPDLKAVDSSMILINQKRSFYLGLPESYISGEQTGGLGTTGENDTKAIERGLKNYFESIIKPVLHAVFDINPTYKSQDFRQIENAMDVLKTFSLTDDTLVSAENKLLIVNRLLDLPENSKGDAPPKVDPLAIGTQNVKGSPAIPAKNVNGPNA